MTSPITAPDPGQQSLVKLTAGHPLALARLKELMRDEQRMDWISDPDNDDSGIWQRLLKPGSDVRAEIDKALAEGAR